MDGDAEPIVGKIFDPDDFADVLAVHGIVSGGEGKSDEDTHAFVVVGFPGVKIDAVLGSVNADGKILEVVVTGFGRTNAQGLRNLGAATAALFGILFLGRFGHEVDPRAVGPYLMIVAPG